MDRKLTKRITADTPEDLAADRACRALSLAKLAALAPFISFPQRRALERGVKQGEEQAFFWSQIERIFSIIDAMPGPYETNGQGDQAVVFLHYFKGGMDWYVTEKDEPGPQYQAFGYADLGQGEGELGYINLAEIVEHGAELDLHWTPCSLGTAKGQHARTGGEPGTGGR